MVRHSRDFLEQVVSEWELAKQGEVRRISRQRARPMGGGAGMGRGKQSGSCRDKHELDLISSTAEQGGFYLPTSQLSKSRHRVT